MGKLEKLSPFYKQTIPAQCLLTASTHSTAVYGSNLKKGLFTNVMDFRVFLLKSALKIQVTIEEDYGALIH